VKFLVDESLSATVAQLLRAKGHEAIHLSERGLLGTADTDVMRIAGSDDRVVISVDTDFGELLALGQHPGPSVILIRRTPHRPAEQFRLLVAALPEIEAALLAGAIVTLTPDRVRLLPIPPA
jgi:predicted nuclease of predicted toxin-antitoxin system